MRSYLFFVFSGCEVLHFRRYVTALPLILFVSIAPNNCIELQWLSLSILLSFLMGFALHFEGVLFHCFRRCHISLSPLRHRFRRRTHRSCRVSSSPLPLFTNNVPLKPQLIQKNIQMRAHSKEYKNAVISNNRIRKSHLQMRLYSRICISLIYNCVLIKCGSITAFVNVK